MGGGFPSRAATVALLCAASVLLLLAPPASARTGHPVAGVSPSGGNAAPDGEGGSAAGDTRLRRALIRAFAATPTSLRRGQATRFVLRVSGHSSGLRARVELRRTDGKGPVVRVSLGALRAGHRVSVRWAGTRALRAGATYTARVVVVDRYGDLALASSAVRPVHLRIAAPTPAPAPIPAPAPNPTVTPPSGDTAFPVAGPHDYGGADSRFGAGRPGHIHQGQDVSAAEGTSLVAPRPGTIVTVAYQAGGAGYYVIEADADGTHWYAFMHLEKGSTAVAEGQQVSAGQRLGAVGSTGDAAGPHLHFEEWLGPWQAGGHPVDPLPLLQSWNRG